MEFQSFGKIMRLSKPVVITEKLDGTNAQIYICGAEETGWEGTDQPFQDKYALGLKTVGLYMQVVVIVGLHLKMIILVLPYG